jgi:hypothetical protein
VTRIRYMPFLTLALLLLPDMSPTLTLSPLAPCILSWSYYGME